MFIKTLFKKYKGIILYLFFGVCTTVVNIVSYYIFAHLFKCSVMFSTVISWILAVLFAYLTNRKWVFNSSAKTKKDILQEIISFFTCRLATGVVDWLCMFILVDKMNFNDILIKTLSNILVIILNYVASKLIIFKEKKSKKNRFDKVNIKDLTIYSSFLIVIFIFLFKSPLHIWIGKDIYTDSSVFKTVALMMKNGYMPYLHSFDHKGPLLYIYNYIGTIISSYRGIWLIEFASLFVTACYLFKIARLKCNRVISYILVLLSFTLLFNYFEGGNLTEEYALPFIATSLYIFLDYTINGVINRKRLIICGLGLGAVLLLRPNMISVWIVFCIYVFVKSLLDKKFSELKRFILYFLLGMFIVIVPILIWLGINGTLSEFFNQYIIFNKVYTTLSVDPNSSLFRNVWELIFTYFNNIIVMSSFIITIYSIKYDKKNVIYLIYMTLTFLLICISGRKYDHYVMIFIPAIIYPFSVLFECCKKIDSNKNYNIISFILILYLCVNIILPPWVDIIKTIPSYYESRKNDNISAEVTQVSNIIRKNTTKKEKISVYGNWDIIYVVSDRMHATKYSYQFPIGNVSKKIMNEYYNQLQKEKPKIIVVCKDSIDKRIKKFLDYNNYSLIYGNIDDTNKLYLVYEIENDN